MGGRHQQARASNASNYQENHHSVCDFGDIYSENMFLVVGACNTIITWQNHSIRMVEMAHVQEGQASVRIG